MPPIISGISEVLRICARAADAAHDYERLRTLSDEALAARGITREDIPRATLRKLADDT
jgi:uncharacterized protein YjiS (DUF1127 family)